MTYLVDEDLRHCSLSVFLSDVVLDITSIVSLVQPGNGIAVNSSPDARMKLVIYSLDDLVGLSVLEFLCEVAEKLLGGCTVL